MYEPHPSGLLDALFAERPYQGAVPEEASFVFVGLDANYAADLERSPAFQHVLDYHADGVSFWRKHGVHHPFLLPSYRGDGRRYHVNFAKAGFLPADAASVSFIELLHVPTVGRSKLQPSDLDPTHLDRIDALVRAGRDRRIFLSAGVVRLMQESRRFNWLQAYRGTGDLPVIHSVGATRVHLHLHFSNYGKFQAQMDREAAAIAELAAAARIRPSSPLQAA